ncbi:MAG: zinc ABC transporter substrate-binding protein [Alphaproteobacteria bacterium]|nr:zinc ABC transporter substrate-binding protein [Alphaproteobacteria bacterium]
MILTLHSLRRHGRYSLSALLLLSVLGVGSAMAAPPAVVVSIKPLHSLVTAVMRGIAPAELLIGGAETPHSFALKPSQARSLQRADAVFWVGADLEGFLVKPLETLSRRAKVVALSKSVTLLPYRRDGMWNVAEDADDHTKHDQEHRHERGTHDLHFWLDPVLVQTATETIVRTLSDIDNANAARYRRNGDALIARLAALNERLRETLEPVRSVPYLVFHDAFQYFEKRYGLKAIGTVTLNPEHRPGARHLDAVQQRVARGDIRCVFREPQFQPSMLNTIVANRALRISVLDPLGATLASGPDTYFTILENITDSLSDCLERRTG